MVQEVSSLYELAIKHYFYATVSELRGVIGGHGVDWWVMFSESQVRDHGLWCQVREENNAGMGSDIGDWYYPPGATPDGFTLATTSSLPYQSLECTNTIGLLRIGIAWPTTRVL